MELKLLIDKKSYDIGSKFDRSSYLGHIKSDEEIVIIAEECVKLQENKLDQWRKYS